MARRAHHRRRHDRRGGRGRHHRVRPHFMADAPRRRRRDPSPREGHHGALPAIGGWRRAGFRRRARRHGTRRPRLLTRRRGAVRLPASRVPRAPGSRAPSMHSPTVVAMAYWLMKSEPDVFGYPDLVRVKREGWDGVRNYMARNFLRQMVVGDRALFYHSNADPPGVAGI